MSDEYRKFDAGKVAVEGRRLSGYAYKWGELSRSGSAQAGGLREGFERGAFLAAIAERGDRNWPYLDTHYDKGGRSVGGIRFSEDEIGLRYEGLLLDNDAARNYALGVTDAGSDEVSLEVFVAEDKSTRKGDALIHKTVRRIGALAGVPYGAFAGATVAIHEDAGGLSMPEMEELQTQITDLQAMVKAGPLPLTEDQTRAIAKTVAEDVARSYAETIGKPAPKHALAEFHSLGELMVAAYKGDAPSNFVQEAGKIWQYALDDVVSTAGANAALLTGNLTVRDVAGIVSRGRPAITAFGGPRGISDTGLSVTWPYFDGTLTDFVGAQSAQKAEILSSPLDIKLGTEALVTYAGGADVALQLIRQADPAVLDIFGRVVLTAWGVVTDAAFVTELESGSVTKDMAEAMSAVDLTEFIAAVIDMSVSVETATGTPAEFILASSTGFAQFAKLIAAQSTALVTTGDLNLRTLGLGIGNIPLIHVPSITAGKFIVSNSSAARWHEAGPFYITAMDVAKLGQNVAWWSLGAGARYIPAGIIEYYDVTP